MSRISRGSLDTGSPELDQLQNAPVHPGVVFRSQFREPLHVSVADAASRLGVPASTLNAIEQARRPVSASMAVKLAALTHVSAETWGRLQVRHDIWHALQRTKSRQVLKGRPFPIRVKGET
jgi:antitoxin HigA-1